MAPWFVRPLVFAAGLILLVAGALPAKADCPAGCDDGNPCTYDTCDPDLGCLHAYNSDPCSDGNACTTNDTCNGGACVGGNPAPGCSACDAVATLPAEGAVVLGQTSGASSLQGSCGTTLGAKGSRVSLSVTAGQTYYVAVDGANGGAGSFAVHVTPAAGTLQCSDGLDNNGNGLIDFDGGAAAGVPPGQRTAPDTQCTTASGGSEAGPKRCGLLGLETLLPVGVAAAIRRRLHGGLPHGAGLLRAVRAWPPVPTSPSARAPMQSARISS